MSTNTGAMPLAGLCAGLEAAAQTEDASQLELRVQGIDEEIGRVLAAFEDQSHIEAAMARLSAA